MGVVMQCVVCGRHRKLIDKMFCSPKCKTQYFKKPRKQDIRSNRWNRKHLINKYGNICHLCGEPITDMKQVTVDHVIPISKGGADTLDNMRPAHESCNRKKGNTYEPDTNGQPDSLLPDTEL